MRRPDYITISMGAGVGKVGISGSITVDRFGQIHENGSLGHGISSGPISTSISAGWLEKEIGDENGAKEKLNQAIDELGGHISIEEGIGGSIVANEKGIQAYEVGFFTPQVDVGVGYQINYMTLFEQLLDEYSKKHGPAKGRFDRANHVDPIVLDLSKNGIQTTGMNGSAHFDYDGNGFSENTGWVTGGTGFLVMDRWFCLSRSESGNQSSDV